MGNEEQTTHYSDATERLTPELVSTKQVTDEEDIRDFLRSLEVPVHNRWVDLRSKELGAFDYEPVELVVSYEFRSVEDRTGRSAEFVREGVR